MEKALAAQMLDPGRPCRRCDFGRASGSSDRVRKNLVAARDIGESEHWRNKRWASSRERTAAAASIFASGLWSLELAGLPYVGPSSMLAIRVACWATI